VAKVLVGLAEEVAAKLSVNAARQGQTIPIQMID